MYISSFLIVLARKSKTSDKNFIISFFLLIYISIASVFMFTTGASALADVPDVSDSYLALP